MCRCSQPCYQPLGACDGRRVPVSAVKRATDASRGPRSRHWRMGDTRLVVHDHEERGGRASPRHRLGGGPGRRDRDLRHRLDRPLRGRWHASSAPPSSKGTGTTTSPGPATRRSSTASGEWILWLDADEAIHGDAAAFRARLGRERTFDCYLVPIESLEGGGLGVRSAFHAGRVFRRESCHWNGPLHEQIVFRDTGEPTPPRASARSCGSSTAVTRASSGSPRTSSQRNLRIAEAALDDPESRSLPGAVRLRPHARRERPASPRHRAAARGRGHDTARRRCGEAP